MDASETCNVCIEKYSDNLRRKVSCNYCNYVACVRCTQKYLLSSIVDAHCMSCRTGWNREFLDINMTKSFRTGDWKEHKKKLIVNREKALLPTMQRYAAAKKSMDEINPIQSNLMKEMAKTYEKLSSIEKKLVLIKVNANNKNIMFDISELDNEHSNFNLLLNESNMYRNKYYKENLKNSLLTSNYVVHYNIYNDLDQKAKERKEFVLKCVKEGCRGFLSSAYKCELCSTFVCKDCMIIKDEKNDKEHVCKKDDIDTVAMIRKDTRPCPKCGIRISKVDGCDQMFCINDGCNVAFSWNTGEIISGVIHNPHYYEWVRRNNNGVVAPVNPIPCDQHVGYADLYRTMTILSVNYKDKDIISQIHRIVSDIQHIRLPSFPDTRERLMFKELHCEFLLNRIDESAWKQSMFLKENNFEKKQAIGIVLRTFVTVSNDNMTKFYQELILLFNDRNEEVKTKIATQLSKEFVKDSINLRNYINKSLVKTGITMMCAVPQININWEWQSIRKVEHILENDPSLSNTL